MAGEPLLRPEEVASVLGTPDEAPVALEAEAGSQPFSLRRPLVLARAQEPVAQARLARYASVLENVIARELEARLECSVAGFRQEQAGAAVASLGQPAWVLAFQCAEGGGLALALDATSALALVEVALGGAGNSAGGAREPTMLESRVLQKLCAAIAGPLGTESGTPFIRGTFVTERVPDLIARPGQTVGIGVLKLRISEHDQSGLLIASAALLRPPRVVDTPGEAKRIGPLAARLARVVVPLKPVLRSGLVGLGDLAGLAPGAVLRLAASEHTPLELRVLGQTLFCGTVERKAEGAGLRVSWRRGRRPASTPKEGKR